MSATPQAAPPPPTPHSARPPTPWWAVLLTIAGVTVVLAMVVGVVGALTVAAATSSTRQTLRGDGVSGLRVISPSGGVDVTVEEGLGDRVVIDLRTTTRWREAQVRSTREAGELIVEVECDGGGDEGWPGASCGGEFDVRLGPEADLTVELGSGGVLADSGLGLGGDVAVSVGVGGVSLEDMRASTVEASVATGGVDLTFAEAPTAVTADVGVGGINIELPDDGTAYAVTSDVGVGGADTAVTRERSAQRTIELSAGVGVVWVGYVGDPESPLRAPESDHDWSSAG